MQWFKLRPTFECYSPIQADEAKIKLQEEYERRSNQRFRMWGEYGELHLPLNEHRFWSPQLTFYVSEQEHGCCLFGRFAPRHNVWTFVWIVYLFMAFSAFYGLALGYAQWRTGATTWGCWVAMIALLLIGMLYVIAHFGQQWSVDQMYALRSEFDAILLRIGLSTPPESLSTEENAGKVS